MLGAMFKKSVRFFIEALFLIGMQFISLLKNISPSMKNLYKKMPGVKDYCYE